MAGYMRHLIGPYGPKGLPKQLSASVIEALQYEKWWREQLDKLEKAADLQAIREGRWTTFVNPYKEVLW